jgi:Family of unknown function (DUF6665)
MPRQFSLKTAVDDPLRVELLQEQAISLGRLGRQLEAALDALRYFDVQECRGHPSERQALVAEAGTVLWHFVVQREACGLRDSARVMEDYRVPKEVRGRMGVIPNRATTRRRR